jgi:hypothetical protein
MKVRSPAPSDSAVTPHPSCQVVALMDTYPPPLSYGSTANGAPMCAGVV